MSEDSRLLLRPGFELQDFCLRKLRMVRYSTPFKNEDFLSYARIHHRLPCCASGSVQFR